jgi:hypothetical protein
MTKIHVTYFKELFTNDANDLIVKQTNLYATQKA